MLGEKVITLWVRCDHLWIIDRDQYRLLAYSDLIEILPPLVRNLSSGPPPFISPRIERFLILPSTSKSVLTRPPLVDASISICASSTMWALIEPPEVSRTASSVSCSAIAVVATAAAQQQPRRQSQKGEVQRKCVSCIDNGNWTEGATTKEILSI